MGYSRKGKNLRPAKRQHWGLIIGVVLVAVCSISTGLFFILEDNKSSPDSYHEPTPEERENNTLRLKSFLGYEFGKTYPTHSEILIEPWYGFTKVEFNIPQMGGPLYSLTFRRQAKDDSKIFPKSDEEQARSDLLSIACDIVVKYHISFSVWEMDRKIYYGKHTEIEIKQNLGMLQLTITDLDFQKENCRQFSEQVMRVIEQRKEEKRQNIKKREIQRRKDVDRM